MQPKKIWANLGVQDLIKTKEFYTTLGFKPNGPNTGKELVSFLIGDNDFIVHFFLKDILEDAMKSPTANLALGNEIIFTLWADSKEEADAWAKEVRNAGGTIFSEPETYGKDYYGFGFADPDGHKWNVFHM